MTQLWHDSGDFHFDEAVLGRIHDDRGGGGGGGGGVGGGEGGGGLADVLGMGEGKLGDELAGLVGAASGSGSGEGGMNGENGGGGYGPMLWNQLG